MKNIDRSELMFETFRKLFSKAHVQVPVRVVGNTMIYRFSKGLCVPEFIKHARKITLDHFLPLIVVSGYDSSGYFIEIRYIQQLETTKQLMKRLHE